MQKRTIGRLVIAALAIGLAGLTVAVSTSSAGAARPLLRATLLDKDGTTVGHVVFTGRGTKVSRAEVHLDAGSVAFGTSDFHGFHIHTVGNCDPTPVGSPPAVFGSAGGHWNPAGAAHGGHAGDMPSVLLQANGKADASFDTDRFEVGDLLDADGSAVVLHAGRDNFANVPSTYSSGEPPVAGPNAATRNTGDAGGRYACGVVLPA